MAMAVVAENAIAGYCNRSHFGCRDGVVPARDKDARPHYQQARLATPGEHALCLCRARARTVDGDLRIHLK